MMAVACAVAEGCIDVCGLLLESKVKSMAHADAQDHVDVHSLCCLSPETICKFMVHAPADNKGEEATWY